MIFFKKFFKVKGLNWFNWYLKEQIKLYFFLL